ncbi:rve domain-containing protein [Gossypium australe]|uniref:Rve domain-containing protein n=1 Tax=Gossypium australe TaxID=47621 RepID=A0A5B6W055_9ROSI|nr:rve domain-containing protein [Gossypium australe]
MSQVFSIDQEEIWMTPIVHTLQGANDQLDKKELTKLQCKVVRYTLLEGVLHRKGFSHPLMQCLTPFEVEYVMREIHEVGWKVASPEDFQTRVLLAYGSEGCASFSLHLRILPEICLSAVTTSRVSPSHVESLGIDVLCPFPIATAKKKFIVVVVDYFTMWIEAEALATITKE